MQQLSCEDPFNESPNALFFVLTLQWKFGIPQHNIDDLYGPWT